MAARVDFKIHIQQDHVNENFPNRSPKRVENAGIRKDSKVLKGIDRISNACGLSCIALWLSAREMSTNEPLS